MYPFVFLDVQIGCGDFFNKFVKIGLRIMQTNVSAPRRMERKVSFLAYVCLISILFGAGNTKGGTNGTTESQYQVRHF
jgi:hypothetical protein